MTKPQRGLLLATSALLIALWMSGCARYVVIPANLEVKRVTAGKPFQSDFNGWFIPDARMLEIEGALNERIGKRE